MIKHYEIHRMLLCILRMSETNDQIWEHQLNSYFEDEGYYKDGDEIIEYVQEYLKNRHRASYGYKKYWQQEAKKYCKRIQLIKKFGWLYALKVITNNNNKFYIYCNGQVEIPLNQPINIEYFELFKMDNMHIVKGDMENVPSLVLLNETERFDIIEVGKYGF